MSIPDSQNLPIAVRAYVCKADKPPQPTSPKSIKKRARPSPSVWALVFDTETTTDASQKLRFGTYQARENFELTEKGIFYEPETLTKSERATLVDYANINQLKVITAQEFIDEIFYYYGYQCRGSIIGFNLPFDISRLAMGHSSARSNKWSKIMRGGFSFKLSEDDFHPNVQIKHISSRNSFMQFTSHIGQRTTKTNREKKNFEPVRRGFFIDTKTLAAALTSQSHSLASLAKALNIQAQKHDTEEHGQTLTKEYIDYAMQDTQTTWECYERLQSMYELHGLKLTASHNIHSEASLGKAYLRDMGIKPWKQMQPDFPDDITGIIMSSYYGGRSEVHIRKEVAQILYCDFLSMYPTVCTLMGLWQFVTAQGMDWQDSTSNTQKLINEITIADLQKQDTWQSLCTLVQVMPDADIFPIRAKYDGDAQYTIGANYLTSEQPLWFTLADCISAKLLTGKAPKILQAMTFAPKAKQDDLKSVCIAGNADYSVDPCEGDFFRRVIDLRSAVKAKIKNAVAAEKTSLENQQLALKILANATSYGIFVELNVEEEKQAQSLLCYGSSGKPIPLNLKKFETTGAFFHPLLATLITGAARLLLAITERQALDAGLNWAFCDTDSMALAKPKNMTQELFYEKAHAVQGWFTPLNPYSAKAPLLKIEDYNYSAADKGTLQPLYCYAVSSKRYALFNLDSNNQPVLRKVSAHGLGHLNAPYTRANTPNLEDSQPWQQDLWSEIIKAVLEKRLPNFARLENFDLPTISRYGATTPRLEKWFKNYNQSKAYSNRVRPFNFLLAMQATSDLKMLKPVASYEKDPRKAVVNCFDRNTGKKVNKSQLKTYLDALAQYHLHPEAKFLNGNFMDAGTTQRRHIHVKSIQHIGKEANKWEEQFFTGFNPDAQIDYGICPKQKDEMLKSILQAIGVHGAIKIANRANLSARHVLNIQKGKVNLSDNALKKLHSAAKALESANLEFQNIRDEIKRIMKSKNISVRSLAKQINSDPSNLSKIISGKRSNLKKLGHISSYLVDELSEL